MGYANYTRQMLADFTGRPLSSFPDPYVTNSAIPQALLLFKMATCLASPDDLTTDQKQMVDFAVLDMSDKIQLNAPYKPAQASPFQSENIGSYSYSYGRLARAVAGGHDTGVEWFDVVTRQLSVCDALTSGFAGGGIQVFENDGLTVGGHLGGQKGNIRFLSPKDLFLTRSFGFDPAPGANPWGLPPMGGDSIEETWFEDPSNPGLWYPVEG